MKKKIFIKLRSNLIKIILKIIIISFSYIYIIYKVKKDVDFGQISKFFKEITFGNTILIFIVFLLMLLNWTTESVKWKKIIRKLQKIKLSTSIKAVFTGITFGIFTPNRIGELGGRVVVLKKTNRLKGILATSIGSFSQFLVTISVGLIGIALLFLFFPEKINIFHKNLSLILSLLILSVSLLSFLFYFNLSKLPKYLLKIKFLKKYEEKIIFFSHYTKKELFELYLYSLLRYIIFITQYFLLLKFFQIEISIFLAFIAISATYLLITLIPAIVILDLGIRGSVSVFFIGLFSVNTTGILLATISIWLVNLVIPAIIGSVFLWGGEKQKNIQL